jgi:hypothetical protein
MPESCGVPKGTRKFSPVYPRLTPWADIISPLRGSILRNRCAVPSKTSSHPRPLGRLAVPASSVTQT